MSGPDAIFDRALMRQRRERVVSNFDAHDFLFREISERLAERAGDVRDDFDLALDAGWVGEVRDGRKNLETS